MLRPILTYGHPALRGMARPVQDLNGDLHQLIQDMVETMYAAPGVGLAATQVGVAQRIAVMDCSREE
ncbi:MAG TPA: peptide deformylase, partial [Candidatus Methylomirabilis sp.]